MTVNSIEWEKYKILQIRDIHEKFIPRVAEYITLSMCHNDLFKVLGLMKEPNIQEELQRFLKHILENDCSVVAIHPETETIFAVGLVKWMTKKWRSWTALRLIITSPLMLEIIEMVVNCFEEEAKRKQCDWDSLHIFYFYVEPEYSKDQCFLQRFFKAICDVASHLHMPRVTYMALSLKHREMLLAQEFTEISRVIYSMYISKGHRPFDHLRDIDELYASLYEKKIEEITPFVEMKIRHGEDIELVEKKPK